MQNLRVVHVLDHSLPVVSGYSIRSHYTLRAQRAAGMQPLAITSPRHGIGTGRTCIDGVEYVRTPRPTRSAVSVLAAGGVMFRLARRLTGEVAAVGPRVLHAHSPVLNGIPVLYVARRRRIPFVYEVRALWEDAAVARGTCAEPSWRYRAVRGLEGWLMRCADRVVVISEGLRDEAVRRGVRPERVVHVPNGVDTAFFRPTAPDEMLMRRYGFARQIVFGYVGSFCQYEGVDVLVRAFAALRATVPNARLVLVGDGEATAAAHAEARALGVEPQIVFAGVAAHAEVRRWYSVCDVCVYPRRANRLTELTTPLKPLEAMAMRKAVIGSAVGGLRELIRDDETGVLCPPGDAAALAQALISVARDPQRRVAQAEAAHRWVCDERDWARLARMYADTYQQLLRPARRHGLGGVADAVVDGGP